ncbi:MAG: hypothetical protein EBZ91_07110, partial [Gammaproteobacteria bacterium]|nr:hypothetical protein [Gammaproteobacteria bacterium]
MVAAALLGLGVSTAPRAKAANLTWAQAATNSYNWNDGANWVGGAAFPNAIDDVANLNAALAGAQTVNLNMPTTLGALNLGATTNNAFTIAAGTNGYLVMDVASGEAAITKTGAAADVISASIQFNDDLTITNNDAAGLLTITGALNSLFANITVTGTGAVSTGSTILGVITTSGNFTKTGAGNAQLNAASTYAGATTISAGRLVANVAASIPVRSAITISSGAYLDPRGTLTFGSIAGAGGIDNPTANARVLTIGRNDTSTTFTGTITSATSGNIAITKVGAGVLTLAPSVASTYTGNTILNGGGLVLDFANSSLASLLAAGTPLQVTGGNFSMKGKAALAASQTVGALTVGATGGSITLTAGDATGTTLTTGAVTATASGSALLVYSPTNTSVKLGTTYATTLNPRLVFTSDNSVFNWVTNTGASTASTGYSAYTSLVATGGSATTHYSLAAAGGTTSQSGAATIGSLKLTGSSAQTLDLSTFNMQLGGGTTATPGAILIDGSANWTINGSTGQLINNTPGTSPDLIFQHFGTGTVTVNAGIGNATALALVKAGPGTLVLGTTGTGSNSFTGAVLVAGGTLSFSSVTAATLGSLGNGSTTAVTLRDGATLQYTGATGTISGAATTAGAHTYVLQGGNANIEVTQAATELTLSGAISGAGGYTKLGPGTLVIGASSTFTGPLFINAGTLRVSGSFQITSTSPVTVASGATLDVWASAASQTMTLGSLSGAGTIVNNGSTNTKTLAFGGDNTTTIFSGIFLAGSAAGNVLTKNGSGIFTLNGSTTSAWTGGNYIQGGIFRLGASNVLASSGTMNIGTSAAQSALELSSGISQTLSALTFYGTNTTATAQGNVVLGSGSTLTLGGNVTVSNTGNGLGALIYGAGTLAMSAARTFSIADSSSVVASGYELTVSSAITGAFALTKVGAGNLLLAGNNSYAGIVVNGASAASAVPASGVVVLSGDNSAVTSTTVLNSGQLVLDYSASNTAKINAAGALSLLGGTFKLIGNAAATSQSVASTTFAAGGFATLSMNPGAGGLVLNLGALTRAAGAGTVRFALSGTQGASNGVITSTVADSTTGLLGTGGGWATVSLGGQASFATVSGGNIVPVSMTTANELSGLATSGATSGNLNLTDSTGYAATLDFETALNSVRFNASGASTLALPAGGILRIDSGGVLQTAAVGGTTSITGGRLVGNIGSELIFTVDHASQVLSVASSIGSTTLITKSGLGTLALSGFNSSTGSLSLQGGTVSVSGGYAIGDAQAVVFPTTADSGVFTLPSGAETIGNLSGGTTTVGNNAVSIGAGAILTVNQSSASLSFGGLFTGTGTLVKSGSGDLTHNANSSASFTGALVINQGQFRLAGSSTGMIGSTVISVNNPGSQLHINHDNNNSPDRIVDTAVITLNNTAPGLGLFFRDSENSASNSETIGSVILGAGHNVIAADYTGSTATRFGTLTLGAAAASVLGRTNKATTLVVGRNLGSVAYGSVAIANTGGRIKFTNTPTGTNAAVGGAGADGTATASIFPYMIGQASTAAPAATDVGNSFVRISSQGLRPLSTTAADGEYVFEAAGFNSLADSTASNVRFTATPGATLNAASAATRTVNAVAIDSAAGAVVVTGPAADTLALTSGALLSTGAAANNTTLTGFAGLATATNSEYVVFVTNNQFTLGSPLTTVAAALTKSGAGSLVLNGLVGNAYTGGTFFNQGLVEASALSNLGPSGNLNFFGGGLRWATGSNFDISARTVVVGTGGAVFDTNGNNVAFATAIGGSGAGGLSKNGLGTLTLNASSTFVGATTVNAGRLQLDGVSNCLPTAAGVTMTSSGSLQLGGTTKSDQIVTELVGTATNSIVGGASTVSTLTINQATVTSFLGFLGGAGTNENNLALVKAGPGTLTLGAVASTFTGGLTIQAGTVIGGSNASTFGAASNVITISPTGSSDAVLNPVNTNTITNTITVTSAGGGSGAAILMGGGTTGGPTLSGAITLVSKDLIIAKVGTTGAFTLTGGVTGSGNLVISNHGTTGAISLTTGVVSPVGTITNSGLASATTTISADIGANVTGIIQKSPTSALILSGTNIQAAGPYLVNAGSLSVTGSAAAALPIASLGVSGGATLNLLNGAAQPINLGSGALSLGAGSGVTTLGLEL